MAGPPRRRHREVPTEQNHTCYGCHLPRPVDQFIAHPERRGWLCLDCQRERARKWDRANRERESARRRRLVARRRARVDLLERVLLVLARADPERFRDALEDEAGDVVTGLRTLGIGDSEWRRVP